MRTLKFAAAIILTCLSVTLRASSGADAAALPITSTPVGTGQEVAPNRATRVISAKCWWQNRQLRRAISNGDVPAAEAALDHGAMPNLRKGSKDDSPLHKAARTAAGPGNQPPNGALARLLLTRGASRSLTNKMGNTPLKVAFLAQNDAVAAAIAEDDPDALAHLAGDEALERSWTERALAAGMPLLAAEIAKREPLEVLATASDDGDHAFNRALKQGAWPVVEAIAERLPVDRIDFSAQNPLAMSLQYPEAHSISEKLFDKGWRVADILFIAPDELAWLKVRLLAELDGETSLDSYSEFEFLEMLSSDAWMPIWAELAAFGLVRFPDSPEFRDVFAREIDRAAWLVRAWRERETFQAGIERSQLKRAVQEATETRRRQFASCLTQARKQFKSAQENIAKVGPQRIPSSKSQPTQGERALKVAIQNGLKAAWFAVDDQGYQEAKEFVLNMYRTSFSGANLDGHPMIQDKFAKIEKTPCWQKQLANHAQTEQRRFHNHMRLQYQTDSEDFGREPLPEGFAGPKTTGASDLPRFVQELANEKANAPLPDHLIRRRRPFSSQAPGLPIEGQGILDITVKLILSSTRGGKLPKPPKFSQDLKS